MLKFRIRFHIIVDFNGFSLTPFEYIFEKAACAVKKPDFFYRDLTEKFVYRSFVIVQDAYFSLGA
jgi:hypothetical protein